MVSPEPGSSPLLPTALKACALSSGLQEAELIDLGNSSVGSEEVLVSEIEAFIGDPEAFSDACESLFWEIVVRDEEESPGGSPGSPDVREGLSGAQLYELTQRLIFSLGGRTPEALGKIAKVFEATTSGRKGVSMLEFKGFVAAVLTQVAKEHEAKIFKQFRDTGAQGTSETFELDQSASSSAAAVQQAPRGWSSGWREEFNATTEEAEQDHCQDAVADTLQDGFFVPAKFPHKFAVLNYEPDDDEEFGLPGLPWPAASAWLQDAADNLLGHMDSVAVQLDEAVDQAIDPQAAPPQDPEEPGKHEEELHADKKELPFTAAGSKAHAAGTAPAAEVLAPFRPAPSTSSERSGSGAVGKRGEGLLGSLPPPRLDDTAAAAAAAVAVALNAEKEEARAARAEEAAAQAEALRLQAAHAAAEELARRKAEFAAAPLIQLEADGLPAYAALGDNWIPQLLLLRSGSSYLYIVAPGPGPAADRQSSSATFSLCSLTRAFRTCRTGLYLLSLEFEEAGFLLLRFSYPEQLSGFISALTRDFRIPIVESNE